MQEWETKSLKEIAQAPPSALSGLAEWADGALAVAHLTTIEKRNTQQRAGRLVVAQRLAVCCSVQVEVCVVGGSAGQVGRV